MMAASLAGYAATQKAEQRTPSTWVTALLTLLTPGLGHVYLGQARRGIALFILIMIADTLLLFAMMGVLARFWMFAVSLALLLGLWLFIMADAITRARRTASEPGQSYNRWQIYVGAFVLACLIFAAPCIYGLHAKASGQLGYFRAAADSMEPTLRRGEYFLADSTFYRSRQPSRGEVAVYVHPKQKDIHVIKRIVAIEGDRIAIRDGRAIVNGMAVEEPYVEAGASRTPFANMAETSVPLDHVFVLGDNRANSEDSRNTSTHGAVPMKNLIGRVTDIAFSSDISRMGLWIGTPSNL
jgi:signal peptidase I